MPLLVLPNELLLNITQSLTRPRDIYHLLLTSRRFANLLLPIIHKSATEDKDGLTALQWAASHCYPGLALFMLKQGADINYSGTHGTPLFLASEKNNEVLVKLLLDNNADVNLLGFNNYTALHGAAMNGRDHAVRLLLEKGANTATPNVRGHTPLHLAAILCHESTTSLLLEKGAAVDPGGDFQGETPLHCAASRWNPRAVAVVAVLLKHGADITLQDERGRTPFHSATFAASEEMVELFLRYGADVNVKARDGQTPLHLAAANRIPCAAVARKLLENGADLAVRDNQGDTALDLAIAGDLERSTEAEMSRTEAMIRVLLSKGVDMYEPHTLGGQLLFWAVKHGHEDILKMILEKGVDLTVHDPAGRTPLHWAAVFGKTEIVKLLLDKGADVTVKDRAEGKTALAMAAACGEDAVVKLLVEKEPRVSESRRPPALHGSTRGQVINVGMEKD